MEYHNKLITGIIWNGSNAIRSASCLWKSTVIYSYRPSILKDVFPIYLAYQMIYPVYQISYIDVLGISVFKHWKTIR